MPETNAQSAWGIEIGQAALKAMRLRYSPSTDQVVAASFDFVPYPTLLCRPDAVPDELIRQALDTFLSRNQLGSDPVAISVPGQNASVKLIKLPPVDSSKVAEIVKYEARRQIPFPLDEVFWDYQTLGVGYEVEGFLVDAEVAICAMQREQVNRHMKPFLERKIEVEAIQIAPLVLYNYLCYDRLGTAQQELDTHTVLIDIGCDCTTVLFSNSRSIWIRNVAFGGNQFTQALTKVSKLTFAKAEHLKRYLKESPDPRAVILALRPAFDDFVEEIQESIGFFASVNRQVRIERFLCTGSAAKLFGLRQFLQQNLQYDVELVDGFHRLSGDQVLQSPLFIENVATFPVPYGLALQALKLTVIHMSLLPPEIATARLIRRRKPWND